MGNRVNTVSTKVRFRTLEVDFAFAPTGLARTHGPQAFRVHLDRVALENAS